jgi:hypothetical protein
MNAPRCQREAGLGPDEGIVPMRGNTGSLVAASVSCQLARGCPLSGRQLTGAYDL